MAPLLYIFFMSQKMMVPIVIEMELMTSWIASERRTLALESGLTICKQTPFQYRLSFFWQSRQGSVLVLPRTSRSSTSRLSTSGKLLICPSQPSEAKTIVLYYRNTCEVSAAHMVTQVQCVYVCECRERTEELHISWKHVGAPGRSGCRVGPGRHGTR